MIWSTLLSPSRFAARCKSAVDKSSRPLTAFVISAVVVNPSGGFLSFGEATIAQAVLQICELTWQLRGRAEGHQVPNAKVGMSAVLGLDANGGSVVLKA